MLAGRTRQARTLEHYQGAFRAPSNVRCHANYICLDSSSGIPDIFQLQLQTDISIFTQSLQLLLKIKEAELCLGLREHEYPVTPEATKNTRALEHYQSAFRTPSNIRCDAKVFGLELEYFRYSNFLSPKQKQHHVKIEKGLFHLTND